MNQARRDIPPQNRLIKQKVKPFGLSKYREKSMAKIGQTERQEMYRQLFFLSEILRFDTKLWDDACSQEATKY